MAKIKKIMTTEQINILCQECCERITDILDHFSVDYMTNHKRVFGPCPIHGGDNPNGWSLYVNEHYDDTKGIWKCFTHQCHEDWGADFIGFVRALLSNEKGEDVSRADAVDWCCNFLSFSFSSIPINKNRQKFNSIFDKINKKQQQYYEKKWNKNILTNYQIPSQYYSQKRNYSEKVLKKYSVGDSPRTNRAVIPIYDNSHEYIIGMTGRSIYDKCDKCGYYHRQESKCPETNREKINCSKWLHTKGLKKSAILYNLWFSQDYIRRTNTVILVEGPGDVWKLEENDIHNSVAIFGTSISDYQQSLLENLPCMNIVCLLDNDDAGKKAAENVKKNCIGRTDYIFQPFHQMILAI